MCQQILFSGSLYHCSTYIERQNDARQLDYTAPRRYIFESVVNMMLIPFAPGTWAERRDAYKNTSYENGKYLSKSLRFKLHHRRHFHDNV